jgi:predicted TIM-barrel fold metal-dependent hydrolase
MLKGNDIINFINKHSADKILFGTDSPWAKQNEYINFMNNLNISKDNLNKIMGLNAKKLLNL